MKLQVQYPMTQTGLSFRVFVVGIVGVAAFDIRSDVVSPSGAGYDIVLPDRQLCCAPVDSPEDRDYLGAMTGAVNFAFVKRGHQQEGRQTHSHCNDKGMSMKKYRFIDHARGSRHQNLPGQPTPPFSARRISVDRHSHRTGNDPSATIAASFPAGRPVRGPADPLAERIRVPVRHRRAAVCGLRYRLDR